MIWYTLTRVLFSPKDIQFPADEETTANIHIDKSGTGGCLALLLRRFMKWLIDRETCFGLAFFQWMWGLHPEYDFLQPSSAWGCCCSRWNYSGIKQFPIMELLVNCTSALWLNRAHLECFWWKKEGLDKSESWVVARAVSWICRKERKSYPRLMFA